MQSEVFYGLFPARIRELLQRGLEEPEKLQEVRLRPGHPLLLRYDGREYGMTAEGTPEIQAARGIRVSGKELRETLEYLSGYSLYAFDEEMKQGFLTVPGGHRVGIAGKIVMEGSSIQCIRHISSVNIRFAHQVRGCADLAMRYVTQEGSLCHTLIVSPPRCGKTTLMRDMIRQISDGTPWLAGMTVGVVDERSELAGSWRGIPQNDLGMRTDVLDGCPKAEGVMMLLRSMAPEVIAVDEIGNTQDSYALEAVFYCGCKLIATVHGASLEDIRRKPLLGRMVREQLFQRYVLLGGDPVGSVREILDGQGAPVYRREAGRDGRRHV